MQLPKIDLGGLSPAQILSAGYLIVIFFGTVLLMLPFATVDGQGLDLIDALFTATSATCVTGLVVVTTGTTFTVFGQLVIMLLIQIGGLGIMTMSTAFALIMGRKITLRQRLIIQEDLNQLGISGLLRLIQYILAFTFTIEGLGALLFFIRLARKYPLKKAIFYSIFHSVSAFNNAGFDLFGNSLESFVGDPLIILTAIILIVLGGLGFTVLVELFDKRKLHSLHAKMVIVTTVILLLVGFIVIFALEYSNSNTMANLSLGEKIMASFFLSVTPRTAGFNTVPTGALRESTLFFIMILMFIGASPGSTGGGIKTTTIGTIVFTLWTTVRGKKDVEIFKRRLDEGIIFKSLTILMLSLLLVLVVTLILSVTEESSLVEILFETVSAFGTVGLSTGITPTLSKIGRMLIIITMFTGRVGPLTLAVAMSESKKKPQFHYPKEKIMVG
ncbi:Trk family potassium uptake protein [Anoxybacter fermentans]|uniref:Trk family potassium uptake protein n=1 Tax=Anoxybacter fermentans TaxID=1323375 RepID=A0A3S9T2X1_9FIRM|nr:Trk family potassium uptake protein [Anoxybacter fermentans]